MVTKRQPLAETSVTAPNGVTWRRHAGATSTGSELLRALADLVKVHTVESRWDWWEEGRQEREHDALCRIIGEWDSGAPEVTEEEAEAKAKAWMDKFDREHEDENRRRADLVAGSYDKGRETLRLKLLRTESDAAFLTRVLQAPASSAQTDEAERRIAERRATAADIRDQLGDPEQVIDRHGHFPGERREMHLREHVDFWRHPRLREFATTDRRRFNALLKMPMPEPAAMCSECQAPAEWHDYDFSLRLFYPPPEPGSRAATLSGLLPGWWERCPACTAYNVEHRWGGKHELSDFTGDQWIGMLPPLLRAIFIKTERKPRSKRTRQPKPEPLAVILPGPISEVMAQLADAQAKHPTAQVRRGPGDSWELWPS